MKTISVILILSLGFAIGVYFILSQRRNLPMEPLSRQEAQEIAERYLSGSPYEMTVRSEMTEEFDFGFVFYYAPRKFLETQRPEDLVPGVGPLVVDRRDRKALALPSSTESRQAIEDYQKNWQRK